MGNSGSAHALLRDATAAAHERVDRVFGRFDLTRAPGYAAFLEAHATALMPIERWLDGRADRVIPDWQLRKRGPALARDLALLGSSVPAGADLSAPETRGSIAGILYVVEGSRLGGRVLARRVGAGLPRTYLDAGTSAADWARLLSCIEEALSIGNHGSEAVEAAFLVFDRFEQAARAVLEERAA